MRLRSKSSIHLLELQAVHPPLKGVGELAWGTSHKEWRKVCLSLCLVCSYCGAAELSSPVCAWVVSTPLFPFFLEQCPVPCPPSTLLSALCWQREICNRKVATRKVEARGFSPPSSWKSWVASFLQLMPPKKSTSSTW